MLGMSKPKLEDGGDRVHRGRGRCAMCGPRACEILRKDEGSPKAAQKLYFPPFSHSTVAAAVAVVGRTLVSKESVPVRFASAAAPNALN